MIRRTVAIEQSLFRRRVVIERLPPVQQKNPYEQPLSEQLAGFYGDGSTFSRPAPDTHHVGDKPRDDEPSKAV